MTGRQWKTKTTAESTQQQPEETDKKGAWQFQEEVGLQGIMLERLPGEGDRKELEKEVSLRAEGGN